MNKKNIIFAGLVACAGLAVSTGMAMLTQETEILREATLAGDTATIEQVATVETVTKPLDQQGNTALHIAAAKGRLNVIERLLKAGANPRAINAVGKTPAALAREAGHTDVADRLETASR